MATKKRKRLMCDFETTTDPNDVRVWASCAVDIDTLETVHLSHSIEEFIDFLKDQNTVCYFHNLRFDSEFLFSYLLLNGYKNSPSKKPKTFSTLISDMGQIYSLTVIFDKIGKQYKKVVFYDSLKKLPFKVATIAKTFELPISKGEIDYTAPRPRGYQMTEEEKEYIIHDCWIVARALQIQFEEGLTKMTTAGDAMGYFKDLITPKTFDFLFPKFPVEMDADIRQAYKGGYVYLNPKYRGFRGLQGITFDINSLYPSVMFDRLLPFGYPMYFEGKPDPSEKYPLYIVRFECAFDLKKDHLPTIQLKNNRAYVETEYLTTSNGERVEMVMTNVDLALMLDHYDTDTITYINGWKFQGVSGVFCEYIDYWMKIKETTTGAKRQLAKLQLNSLYGRFAQNPKAYKKHVFLDAEGIVRYKIINNDKVAEEYGAEPPELRDPVYTAMGAFITAYAREKTIRSGQSVYDRFIYADTDSLHLVGYDVPEILDVHPTRLGAWKNEGLFTDSKFIRAKTYMETTEDGTKVTCAGMPENVKEKVTYDNFRSGSTFTGKLLPRRYRGGVILTDTTFTIK